MKVFLLKVFLFCTWFNLWFMDLSIMCFVDETRLSFLIHNSPWAATFDFLTVAVAIFLLSKMNLNFLFESYGKLIITTIKQKCETCKMG
jgi:hypothetical protein